MVAVTEFSPAELYSRRFENLLGGCADTGFKRADLAPILIDNLRARFINAVSILKSEMIGFVARRSPPNPLASFCRMHRSFRLRADLISLSERLCFRFNRAVER